MGRDEIRKQATDGWRPPQNALIIQGSPRGPKGWTDHCLDYFVQGMETGGLKSEKVYLKDKKIKHCVGCFTCWEKTPGVCIHKGDDMPELLEKVKACDALIFALPLYYFTLPGLAKNFLDRMLPMVQPFLVEDKKTGLTSHPSRYQGNCRVVLLSVCGFPEIDHFEPLSGTFRRTFGGGSTMLVGEVLRPAAEAMANRAFFEQPYQAAMDAIKKAGAELATQGYVAKATEQAAAAPFFEDNQFFYQMANLYWKASMQYNQAKRDGLDVGSFEDYFNEVLAKQ